VSNCLTRGIFSPDAADGASGAADEYLQLANGSYHLPDAFADYSALLSPSAALEIGLPLLNETQRQHCGVGPTHPHCSREGEVSFIPK
jgi:hypothetical protein